MKGLIDKLKSNPFALLSSKTRREVISQLEAIESEKKARILTEEDLKVLSHFEAELSEAHYNAETFKNKGLRTINENKAEWLSKLLSIVHRLSK